MAVYITEDDALERIVRAECGHLGTRVMDRYRSEQMVPREYRFAGVCERGTGVIYGLGGVHRYIVFPNGEIKFSEYHGDATRALEEGFRTI